MGAGRLCHLARLRVPHLSASESHRPAEARHHARSSARGRRRRPGGAPSRASDRLRTLDDRAGPAGRSAHGRDPLHARRADGRGRLRAAHRLRQRRKPAARTHRSPRTRPRAAGRARRQPGPHRPAADGGERPSRHRRRPARALRQLRHRATARSTRPVNDGAACRRADGRARARVLTGLVAGDGLSLRPPAGNQGIASEPADIAARRRTQVGTGSHVDRAPPAGGRRCGHGGRAAHRGGLDDQERRPPDRRQSRLRSRARPVDADFTRRTRVRDERCGAGEGRRHRDAPPNAPRRGRCCCLRPDPSWRQRRHMGLSLPGPAILARRSVRRTLRGHARLLLGDADPAPPWTSFHRRRWRRRRKRDADRRAHRPHVVARRRSDRTACEDWRRHRSVAHHRRHRRRRATSGSRDDADDADVPAAIAEHRFVPDAGDPDAGRSVAAGQRRAASRRGGGTRRAGVSSRAADGSCGAVDRTAPLCHGAARALWRAGAAHDSDRRLRGDFVHSGRTDTRNRHSGGAGRAACRHPAAGHRRGAHGRLLRSRRRPLARIRRVAVSRKLPVQREHHRSRHVCIRRRGAVGRRSHRASHPDRARNAHRSDDRAATGLTQDDRKEPRRTHGSTGSP